ncbi:MAG: hypothetical protein IPJ88_04095 [Myxococcales bacterium]|nr:MAG: hypothetical protein IPJ88_04095 [Myxococcales bacterium]
MIYLCDIEKGCNATSELLHSLSITDLTQGWEPFEISIGEENIDSPLLSRAPFFHLGFLSYDATGSLFVGLDNLELTAVFRECPNN